MLKKYYKEMKRKKKKGKCQNQNIKNNNIEFFL